MSKILVLGDICVDVNYYGNVHKISPEAPIPIFSVESKEEIPGMSGNVIRNLKNAGNHVVSYTKDDLCYPMTTKSRYFAGKHYLYRIDDDKTEILKEGDQKFILSSISDMKDLDAVVLQDYHKGFFAPGFIQKIIQAVKKVNNSIPVIADGHKSRDLFFYRDVDYLKVNDEEAKVLLDDCVYFPNGVIRKGILWTKGENGAILQRDKRSDLQFVNRVDNVVDVTGAGDTFTSWFISELVTEHILQYDKEERAMGIACKAASISVQYLGCYAPKPEEVYK